MIEDMLDYVSGQSGLTTVLRGAADGGFSAYVGKGKVKSKFCDGGTIVDYPIVFKAKGSVPSELISGLENACKNTAACIGYSSADGKWEICGIAPAEPPAFESSEKCGLYMVGCTICVSCFIKGGGE